MSKSEMNLCDRKYLKKILLFEGWAPRQLAAFSNLASSVFETNELSTKEKELIAMGCAHSLKCAYCIDYHISLAQQAGAGKEDIAETAWIGIFVAGKASFLAGKKIIELIPDDEVIGTVLDEPLNKCEQSFEASENMKNLKQFEHVTLSPKNIDSALAKLVALARAQSCHSVELAKEFAILGAKDGCTK